MWMIAGWNFIMPVSHISTTSCREGRFAWIFPKSNNMDYMWSPTVIMEPTLGGIQERKSCRDGHWTWNVQGKQRRKAQAQILGQKRLQCRAVGPEQIDSRASQPCLETWLSILDPLADLKLLTRGRFRRLFQEKGMVFILLRDTGSFLYPSP